MSESPEVTPQTPATSAFNSPGKAVTFANPEVARFVDRIEGAIASLHISRAEACRRMGVSNQTLRNWVTGVLTAVLPQHEQALARLAGSEAPRLTEEQIAAGAPLPEDDFEVTTPEAVLPRPAFPNGERDDEQLDGDDDADAVAAGLPTHDPLADQGPPRLGWSWWND